LLGDIAHGGGHTDQLSGFVLYWGAGSIDQRNTACSLSAGVSKPKVFRGR
jgi:hypothetical protein